MPSVVGNRKSTADIGRGYNHDPLYKYAAAFNECVTDILNENGVDLYTEPGKAMMYAAPKEALKRFFMEGTDADNEEMVKATDPESFEDIVEENAYALGELF